MLKRISSNKVTIAGLTIHSVIYELDNTIKLHYGEDNPIYFDFVRVVFSTKKHTVIVPYDPLADAHFPLNLPGSGGHHVGAAMIEFLDFLASSTPEKQQHCYHQPFSLN